MRKEPARDAAIAAGRKTYFTGRPCKRGHVAERRVSDWSCVECRQITSHAHYLANRAAVLERTRAHQKAHPEQNNRWAKRNPARAKAAVRAWAIRHREKRRTSARKYHAKHAEQENVRRAAYHRAHREQYREIARKWRHAHPEKISEFQRNRYARRKAGGGTVSAADIDALLNAQKNRCAYCGCDVRLQFHVDHIVALANGGRHERSNLQITCPSCNLSKGAKDPIVFAQQLGRLL